MLNKATEKIQKLPLQSIQTIIIVYLKNLFVQKLLNFFYLKMCIYTYVVCTYIPTYKFYNIYNLKTTKSLFVIIQF